MSVLILMYHGVERRAGPLHVEPSLFAEHVDVVARSGLPVLTVAQLAAGDAPQRAVALTFDDAFASVVEQAAPLLAARELPATVFCVAGLLGRTSAWPSARPGAEAVPLAGAFQLAELARAGFEIGAHGMEHEPLDTGDEAVVRREVIESRGALEQELGVAVSSFAYPYGILPSAAARRAVAATYSTACTTRIGRVGPGVDPLALPRVDAHYLRSPERLAAALAGGAETYLRLRRLGAGARRRLRRDAVSGS